MKSRLAASYFLVIILWGFMFAPFSFAHQKYFTLGGGGVVGDAPDKRTETFGDVQTVTYDGENGWGMFLAFGIDWQSVRAEFESVFRRYRLGAAVTGNTGTDKSATYTEATSLMVNIFYDIHLMDRFELSLGGGVGGSFFAIDDFNTANYSVGYIPGWESTYQLVAELSCKLNNNTTLGVRYHFLDIFDTGNENASASYDIFASIGYHF